MGIWELRLPLRSVTHGEDELSTDQKYTGETENSEYDEAYFMAERVELGI